MRRFDVVVAVWITFLATAAAKAAEGGDSSCSTCPVGVEPGAAVVCGADGFTYANACLCQCQNIEVASKGGCPGVGKAPLFIGDTRWQPSSNSDDRGPAAEASAAALAAAQEKVPLQAIHKYAADGYRFVGKAVSGAFIPTERRFIKPVGMVEKDSTLPKQLQGSYTYDVDTGFLYRSDGSYLAAAAAAAAAGAGGPSARLGFIPPALMQLLLQQEGGTPQAGYGAGGDSSSSGGNGRRLKSVWGADDRIEITQQGARWPYSAITHLSMGCTGVLISRSAVLTAAHCVYDPWSSGWQPANQLLATPGAHRSAEQRKVKVNPYGRIHAEVIHGYSAYIDTEEPAFDIAVIRLRDPVGEKTGWFGMKQAPLGLYKGMLFNAGFPGDKPERSMWTDQGVVKDRSKDNFINHRLDTFGGNSGSPLWVTGDDKGKNATICRVIAVHGYGGGVGMPNNNAGVALTEYDVQAISVWAM